MDDKIRNNMIEKSRMKIAISNLETEELKRPKRNLSKLVATFILTIGTTAGLVYAGSAVYEKIWKEPTSYQITQGITEEEKAQCISEQEAEKIGNEYLKKVGFSDETIQNITLEKDWKEQENNWYMNSQKASFVIDGKTGNIKSATIPTRSYTIPENYGITRQEAKKVAYELLEKYKPENSQGTYELLSLKGNGNSEADSYIWYAEFYKKYDDLINPAEKVFIGWIPTINSLYCLDIDNYAYENNEQVISKEEAMEIAKNKDKEINPDGQIKTVQADTKIEQMNESVFLREKYGEEYESGKWNKEKIRENVYKIKDDAVFYKTEERVRKVWRVVIEYDKSQTDNSLRYYAYYVDATTGEIIGGEIGSLLTYEDNIKSDVHNMV